MSAQTQTTGTARREEPRIVVRTGPGKFVTDTRAVFTREILLTLRDPFTLIFSLLQPLVFLGLFAPLLTGTFADTGMTTAQTLQWFVPGVIVMISLFGTSMTGSNLLYELMTGSYERVLATPLDRSAILVGRALKEFAPLVVQGLLIAVLCLPFGFRFNPLHAVAALALLGIFGIGVGALSYALGLAAKNREWLFWGVQQALIFPLLILSGMMLPLETGPGWMQVAARFNPLTYIVDAERALFAGDVTDPVVLWGLVAAVVTCAGGLLVGVRTTRRHT
ncbi:ABC transporter permease [Isoptericola halotolerans]|uniref:Transport permease protein n=1 Tax=Isoptericola halotolerans TaxID=300560 RepID=A0ABX2A2E5_9MICO|nr:ABC transporter permease [Isoptericola halotolerans]NOV95776.1 ABC-2 type transport system permease protein [Isoptericola halotolerans]